MRSTDLDYYERRLREETAKANAAELDCVRWVHIETADLYRERIDQLKGAAGSSNVLAMVRGGGH